MAWLAVLALSPYAAERFMGATDKAGLVAIVVAFVVWQGARYLRR